MEQKGSRLKPLQEGQTEFQANGKKYFIEQHISAKRWQLMKMSEIEMQYGLKIANLYQNINKGIEILNKAEFVNASVHFYNLSKGTQTFVDRVGKETNEINNPILRYCTLFINRDDEDRRGYDEKVAEEKIKDWLEEGIPFQSFLVLALRTSEDMRAIFLQNTPNSSEQNQTGTTKKNQ